MKRKLLSPKTDKVNDMPIVWEDIDKVIPHEKNRNKHPEDQIKRLSKIIKYQGWRHPIIVATNDGKIAAGHGRLLAAKELGLRKVPVQYQSFLDDEQLYAFRISDNAIALWAELDLEGINTDLPDYGPELDFNLLGIDGFRLDANEKMKKEQKVALCPSCGFVLNKAKEENE